MINMNKRPMGHIAHLRKQFKSIVTGKRGNVEMNNSPQAGIEPGASRFKIKHSTE